MDSEKTEKQIINPSPRIDEQTYLKRTKSDFYFFSSLIIALIMMLMFIIMPFAYQTDPWSLYPFIVIIVNLIIFLALIIQYRKYPHVAHELGVSAVLFGPTILILAVYIHQPSDPEVLVIPLLCGPLAIATIRSSIYHIKKGKIIESGQYVDWEHDNVFQKNSDLDTKKRGLMSNWDYPVLSPEERRQNLEKVHKDGLKSGIILFILGIIITIGIFLFPTKGMLNQVIWTIGLICLLFGGVILYVIRWVKRNIMTDRFIEVKAGWNITDFELGKKAVETFLSHKKYSYSLKLDNSVKKALWKIPKHIYELDDGNQIILMFTQSGKQYMGWFEIRYKLEKWQDAKRLQKEIDNYLVEKNILLRKSLIK